LNWKSIALWGLVLSFGSACSDNDTITSPEPPPLSSSQEAVSSSSSSLDIPIEPASSSSAAYTDGGALRSPCEFSFGAGWRTKNNDETFFRGLDHMAVWIGDNAWFNTGFEGLMLHTALRIDAVPMFYAYVIAEFGKDHGLDDCDTGKLPNLCTQGAAIIRQYWADSILARYSAYASGVRDHAASFFDHEVNPDTLTTIWLIEPDFYQYSVSGSEQDLNYDQEGGGIPDAEMGKMVKQIIDTIHTYLPAARISLDISPWITNIAKLTAWYANFDMDRIDYVHTSGGRTLANSENIRSGQTKWSTIHDISGKPIIADAGYGTSGTGLGHAKEWDKPININARIANGVVAITQMDAALDYPDRATELRSQITPLLGCPSP